jgi:hypothetical protein
MANFLLLPPRPAVGEEIARLIRPYLPGVRVTAADCVRFLDALVTNDGQAFLVHREELPDEEDVATALRTRRTWPRPCGTGSGPSRATGSSTS